MSKLVALLIMPILLLPSLVQADPLLVRSAGGDISSLTLDFEGDFFRFVGDSFMINQSAPENVGLFFTHTSPASCDPCTVGDVFDPSFRTTGEIPFGTGTATFGDTTFSNVTLSGTLEFNAAAVSFPNVPGDGFVLRTPFSFEGFVRGTTQGREAFGVALAGHGQALRFFDRFDSNTFGAGENHQTFLFDSSDRPPVPEPGTMLLLATGGAWLAARRRIDRKSVPAVESGMQ